MKFLFRALVGMPHARAGLSPASPSCGCCRSRLSPQSSGPICQRSSWLRFVTGWFRDPLLSLRDGLFSSSTLARRAAMPSGYLRNSAPVPATRRRSGGLFAFPVAVERILTLVLDKSKEETCTSVRKMAKKYRHAATKKPARGGRRRTNDLF